MTFMTLASLLASAISLLENADNNYKRRQIYLPWSELSTVETRWQGTALILFCVPKPGSGLSADGQAKKLWSESLRGYVVIDLTTLGGSPDAVTTALVRYSGGRYRPEGRACDKCLCPSKRQDHSSMSHFQPV